MKNELYCKIDSLIGLAEKIKLFVELDQFDGKGNVTCALIKQHGGGQILTPFLKKCRTHYTIVTNSILGVFWSSLVNCRSSKWYEVVL